MAREQAETVSKGWRFKEQHHVHADGTRRGRNREQQVVLQERQHIHPDGTRRR